jgi:hypothetical protein
MQARCWVEEGVLLFFPSESRTEGGRRQESDEAQHTTQSAGDIHSAAVRGSCRLPRFMATPGPVKSTAQNSPGSQHEQPPDRSWRNTREYHVSTVYNGHPV